MLLWLLYHPFFKDNELILGIARCVLRNSHDGIRNNCTSCLNAPWTREVDVISQKLLGYNAWNTGYRIGKC